MHYATARSGLKLTTIWLSVWLARCTTPQRGVDSNSRPFGWVSDSLWTTPRRGVDSNSRPFGWVSDSLCTMPRRGVDSNSRPFGWVSDSMDYATARSGLKLATIWLSVWLAIIYALRHGAEWTQTHDHWVIISRALITFNSKLPLERLVSANWIWFLNVLHFVISAQLAAYITWHFIFSDQQQLCGGFTVDQMSLT